MKFKITALTPIHIGTGETIPNYTYHQVDNKVYHYDIEDIIYHSGVSVQDLNKLHLENTNPQNKARMIDFFCKKVDYARLMPKYMMYSRIDIGSNDFSEQIKTFNKPYIPGSSIKGALMNAILFYLLKKKENELRDFLKRQSRPDSRTFEKDLYAQVFGQINYEENGKSKHITFDEIFSGYSSCVICRDIIFDRDSIGVVKEERLNMAKNQDKNASFVNLECIAIDMETESELFFIDESRKNNFEKQLINKNVEYKKLFSGLFNVDNLLIILRNFYRYVSKEDFSYFNSHEFPTVNGINISDDILDFYNRYPCKDDAYTIMRVGKDTNYFYKSTTLFIRNIAPDFYSNHFDLFAPVPLYDRRTNGLKKNAPKPDQMPKTRTVITDDEQYYFIAGMLKIEKCN